LASFTLALNSPHIKLQPQAIDTKQVRLVTAADTRYGFPRLKQEIRPRIELDISVSKSASFGHGEA
jgi:hypothetical protein